jgi:hypothetical protein
VLSISIVSAYGTALRGAPGDAIPLVVRLLLSDGTTATAPQDQVAWVAPATVVAQDPTDAGASVVPGAGSQPTSFYVRNDYRQTMPGMLFIVDRGTLGNPQVTVTATYLDAGVSATVAILPDRVGDAAAGESLFQQILQCAGCHGTTAAGSPWSTLPDGAVELVDGSPIYIIGGQAYPFPAPGLNAAPDSGNLADDPAWSAGMFAVAAQSGIDNQGVALRLPMPLWAGGNDGTGKPLDAQDFADIYAWLLTQTQ